MRVLQVIARMNVGGTARYLDELVTGLSAAGVEVALATGYVQGDEAEDAALSRLPVMRVPHLGRAINPLADLRARQELKDAIRRFQPDIIHTHTFKAGLLGRTLARPVPHVHTFHGYSLNDPEFQGVKASVMAAAERLLVWHTEALVAITQQVARELAASGIGTEEAFTIIPPGVRPLARLDRETARQTLGLSADALVVAWLARFAPVKAPERVLELAYRFPDITFLMAGGGDLQEDIASLAPANVRVLGWSDPAEIYAAADIALLTSHSEGFGIALVEAQMAGLPVVATRVGGVPEAVLHEQTGLVVPADELPAALGRLSGDPALRQTFGTTGRDWANREFTVEKMVQRHLDLYRRMIGRNGPAA